MRDMLHRNDGHHMEQPNARHVRTLASVALVVAAVSATATAAIDAASIADRVHGRVVESRPFFLHTFSISVVTVIVAAVALWGGRLAATLWARLAYGLTALLNLSVPLLRESHPDLRIILPVAHVLLAALLISLILIPERGSYSRGP